MTTLGDMTLRATAYDLAGRSAVITLSRPKRGNAWTGRMHAEYMRCLATAESDSNVRTIVVTGAGSAFCVGGDSEALEGHAKRGGYDDGLAKAGSDTTEASLLSSDVDAEFNHQFSYHFGLTKPVIAAINGPAAGVGLALGCFADLRFAVPGAKLTTAHGKLNLPPEFGLSWILPRHIGLTRAMDLILTSRIFLTDEAHQLGLINQLHPADELLDATLDYAEQLASTVSAGSLRASKQQVYVDQHRGIGQSVEESLRLLNEMISHPDYQQGVAALQRKRPPNF